MDFEYLIKHGSQLRENNELMKSLEVLTRALAAFGKKGDYQGMINALLERCSVWQHYYGQTKEESFLVLAKEDAKAMKEIADLTNLTTKHHTTYYRMGQVAILQGNYGNAVFYFKKALELFKGPMAEKGDWRVHLGEALYRNGQQGVGKKAILKGIGEIKKGARAVDDFLMNVWLSGAYMVLADLQKHAKPAEAKEFLKKAQDIIKKNERLVLRKIQFKDLRKKFI